MPNLGSSDTPVEGQSFGLPAGAELGEDNGDVVIKDSSGTIILRRNETASEWQFEETSLSGINSIDASSATFDALEAENADTRNGYSIVTDSRSLNTVYTNSTNSDLDVEVSVQATSDATFEQFQFDVDGSYIHRIARTLDKDEMEILGATVPAGSDYGVDSFGDGNVFVQRWVEQQ